MVVTLLIIGLVVLATGYLRLALERKKLCKVAESLGLEVAALQDQLGESKQGWAGAEQRLGILHNFLLPDYAPFLVVADNEPVLASVYAMTAMMQQLITITPLEVQQRQLDALRASPPPKFVEIPELASTLELPGVLSDEQAIGVAVAAQKQAKKIAALKGIDVAALVRSSDDED